jgi:hypothetical protein
MHQLKRLRDPQPQAFLLGDFEFRDTTGHCIPHSELLGISPGHLRKLFVTIRTQKNSQNGEQRLVTAQLDKTQSELNAVTAGLSIVCQHHQLLGNQLSYDTPLAIHRMGLVPLYITDDGIEQMQAPSSTGPATLSMLMDVSSFTAWDAPPHRSSTPGAPMPSSRTFAILLSSQTVRQAPFLLPPATLMPSEARFPALRHASHIVSHRAPMSLSPSLCHSSQ